MKQSVIIISIFVLIFGCCKQKTTSSKLPTSFPVTDTLNIQQQENLIQKENNTKPAKILDANKLMSVATKIGLKKLEEKVYPTKLIYLDPSFSTVLMKLEFKKGFIEKLYSNKKKYFYDIPKYTFELADEHNDKEALKKLFEYYLKIPKFVKSDTIYQIYRSLNNFLEVLVKSNNPDLPKRLLEDYKQWNELAKTAKPKLYPSREEFKNMSFEERFEESLKFKEDMLYVDCSYIALQLAGALNYLKVEGFDSNLLEKLKQQQTCPYASNYRFYVCDYPKTPIRTKTVLNTEIKKFNKDYDKIGNFLFKNEDKCCGAEISEIIYNESRAYVFVSRNNGCDEYLLKLNTDNTITIEHISMVIE